MDETLQSWCLGVPKVEERPLTPDEMHGLLHDISRVMLGALGGFVGSVAAIPAWIGALLLAGNHPGWMLLAFVLGPVAAGASFLQGCRCVRHVMRLRVELRQGTVSSFAGSLTPDIFPTLHARILRPLKLSLTLGQECAYEIYTGSGRLKCVQGRPSRNWDILLVPVVTAPLPSHALIAAQWLEAIDQIDDARVIFAGQRELTPEELREIVWYMTDAWRSPLRQSLLVAILPGCLAVIGLFMHKPLVAPLVFLGIILGIGLLSSLLGLLRNRAFSVSYRTGVVRIIQIPLSTDPDDAILIEGILNSTIVWTIDGQPAPWRRM